MKPISRRELLIAAGLGLGTVAAQEFLSACGIRPTATAAPTLEPTQTAEVSEVPDTETATEAATQAAGTLLAVAHGEQIEDMVRRGIQALGGIEQYMKSGADVIVKPNICTAYNSYEYAATTNPWVVGALVKLCLEAGAKRVRVMDSPFGGTAEDAYQTSGIADAVTAAGGVMEVMSPLKFKQYEIPGAVSYKKASIYQDILDADLLINVPIAKNHGMSKLTLGMKNLMGTMLYREQIHPSFEKNLVDLNTLVRPQLTVIDAIRTLMANGPTGGDLNDVQVQNTLIFSNDIVAADSYATRLFGKTPDYLPYVMAAEKRGLGKADLSNVKIDEFNV